MRTDNCLAKSTGEAGRETPIPPRDPTPRPLPSPVVNAKPRSYVWQLSASCPPCPKPATHPPLRPALRGVWGTARLARTQPRGGAQREATAVGKPRSRGSSRSRCAGPAPPAFSGWTRAEPSPAALPLRLGPSPALQSASRPPRAPSARASPESTGRRPGSVSCSNHADPSPHRGRASNTWGLGPSELTLVPPPPAWSSPGPKVKVEPGERQAGAWGVWVRVLAGGAGAPG